jgi:glycosyltransferase involved in cell wall biosynthesis
VGRVWIERNHQTFTHMELGLVVDGHRGFIRELLGDWRARYRTSEFSLRELHLPFAQGRINQWRLKRALTRFCRAHDAVFFEWAGPMTIVGSRLPIDTPVIVRLHSWELYEFAPHVEWEGVSRVILVSLAMQRRFSELFPAHAHKTRVVNCGRSLVDFAPAIRRFEGRIGMLCDLVPIKRVYEMVLVLHELRRDGHDYSLHLGGSPRDGSNNQRYMVSLKRAVEKLALPDHVTLYGWVDDPAAWLRNIDIFVSNSYWEGQQNALLEAMASGCHCLSHFWDGAEEILPPQNLYVTDTELRAKILEFGALQESEKALRCEDLRTIVAERFDVERMKQGVREVIEDAVRYA